MITYSKTIRITAILCTMLTATIVVGQDGVVRMSDRTAKPAADGVVRMRALQQKPQIRRVSVAQAAEISPVPESAPVEHLDGGSPAYANGCTVDASCAAPVCAFPDCAAPQVDCGYCPQVCDDVCGYNSCDMVCDSGCGMCCNDGGGCGYGSCTDCECGSCYTPTDCNSVFSSGRRSRMGSRNGCDCGRCGHDRRHRNRRAEQGCRTTLFARRVDSGTGSCIRDSYHGQSMSFRNKNSRLGDKLFGWMVPSGVPAAGCYRMTYADQPDYVNPNDGQIYAAQGYGMPISVPLAPNVNHTYNYSAGIPASRITTIGNYNPMTSPQRLPHQTW